MNVAALLRRTAAAIVIPGLALASLVAPAQAQGTPLRFAYLLTDAVLPILAAEKAGKFDEAGIDLQLIEVQGGPAVVAALASGEVDIGYSAPIPPINARINGVDLKMLLAIGYETEPGTKYVWLTASKASGITSIADVKGKKISFNANGGLCELTWRDYLAQAGIKWEENEPVVLPFPQQEAALQQGVIDAACSVNPFYAAIKQNPEIAPVELAAGSLADKSRPTLIDVVFSTEKYAAENIETIKTFARVSDDFRKTLVADRALLEQTAVDIFGLTAEAAKDYNVPSIDGTLTVRKDDVQHLLDAMNRAGMLPTPITADDMSIEVEY